MDLSFLIPSKTRRLVLAYFVDNPDAQMGVRELARELKTSPQVLYRELLNLESWGFLFSSKRVTQRAFRLNTRFPLYPSIKDLYARLKMEQNKTYEIVATYDLKEMASKLRKIPVPPELIPGLTSKRQKPRSYDEAKFLERLSKK